MAATSRTAVYGPVRTVVWQGSAGNRCPYADQIAESLSERSKRTKEPDSLVPGGSRTTRTFTLVSVGCCSRARVCLDRRSETQIFVDPGAFFRTDPIRN
jgi:hypothetical protein